MNHKIHNQTMTFTNTNDSKNIMRKLIWSISYTHVKKITKFYTRKYIFSYES